MLSLLMIKITSTSRKRRKTVKSKPTFLFDFQWDTAKISTDESNKFTINGKDITITIKDPERR